jgi:hypothetical protein
LNRQERHQVRPDLHDGDNRIDTANQAAWKRGPSDKIHLDPVGPALHGC